MAPAKARSSSCSVVSTIPTTEKSQIDNRDLKDFPVDDLRRLITVLFQQPVHYNTTVRENVLYGDLKLDRSEAEIQTAIRAAGAEECRIASAGERADTAGTLVCGRHRIECW